MKLGTLTKQPAETRLQMFGYVNALSSGDTVSAAALKSVIPTATGGVSVSSVSVTTPNVYFFVSGGADDTDYVVTLTVDTALGETYEDELVVKVREVE